MSRGREERRGARRRWSRRLTFVAGLVLQLALGLPVSAFAADTPPSTARPHGRAARTSTPPTLDGQLAPGEWSAATPLTRFTQIEPQEGQPASLPTTVWVLADDEALYVAARCEDPAGRAGVQQSDLARDFDLDTADAFGITLDTLADGRNAFGFFVNPYGAQKDIQVVDDTLYQGSWDTVWRSATARDDAGWTVELAIPWKSLRTKDQATSFGFNAVRRTKRLGEESGWAPWPRGTSVFRMSFAGVLEGLAVPRPSLLDVQLRPYGIVRAEQVGGGAPDVRPNVGGEVTWKTSSSSVLDLTVNTDFAETDVDRRVVNLGRFNVLLPEKRQFFLESAGVFEAGLEGWLSPFFSRTIGLSSRGTPVHLNGGARFVSRTEDRSVGALVVSQGDAESNALFAVARYSQNLGAESRLGGLVVAKHDFASLTAPASTNLVPVVDGLWRVGPFTVTSFLSGSATQTQDGTPARFGTTGVVNASAQGGFGYLNAAAGWVSPTYETRAGWVSRPESLATSTYWWVDHRPAWLPSWLRSINTEANAFGIWSSRDGHFEEAFFQVSPVVLRGRAGDRVWVTADRAWQQLDDTFAPVPGVAFRPGAYVYDSYTLSGATESSRAVAGSFNVNVGKYFGSDYLWLNGKVQVHPIPHVALSVQLQRNEFRGEGVARGLAETWLLQGEARLALSPRLQLIGSYQRDTAGDVAVANVRLAWELAPLSFLYVVYTDTRGALPSFAPAPPEQRLVAKLTYTWRP